MTNRKNSKFYTYFAVFLIFGLLSIVLISLFSIHSTKPFFIIFLVDTLKTHSVSSYGNSEINTPYFDYLSRIGSTFSQAISTSGWTLPAIASIFTGTWPIIHGASGKISLLTPIRKEIPTVAEILRNHNFRTLCVANAAFMSPMLKLDRGFQVFDHRYAFNWDIRRADKSVDKAIDLISSDIDSSTFIVIHIFDPHLAYDPPTKYRFLYTGQRHFPPPPLSQNQCLAFCSKNGKSSPSFKDISYVNAIYNEEVTFVDTALGKLILYLKEKLLFDRSTIIMVADHGEEFWEHKGFEHGHTLYDELIRIPLIIKPPKYFQTDKLRHIISTQVRNIDIAPTLFSLSKIKAPKSFRGKSLLSLLGRNMENDRMAFSEGTLYGPDKYSLRVHNYKLIYTSNNKIAPSIELYNWKNDPEEKNNLLLKKPDLANKLASEFQEFYQKIKKQSQNMSHPKIKNINPKTIESLKSLGYLN